MSRSKIEMYGADWCSDCRRAKRFFEQHKVEYKWIDIENDHVAINYVKQLNNGKQILPTIVCEDGTILVEPSDAELSSMFSNIPR